MHIFGVKIKSENVEKVIYMVDTVNFNLNHLARVIL